MDGKGGEVDDTVEKDRRRRKERSRKEMEKKKLTLGHQKEEAYNKKEKTKNRLKHYTSNYIPCCLATIPDR